MTCALQMTVLDLPMLPRPSQTVSLAGRRKIRRGFERYGTGYRTQRFTGAKSVLPYGSRSQASANFPRASVLPQLPGVQGLPGPSVYGGGFAPTVESAAQAAAEGWFCTHTCSCTLRLPVQVWVVGELADSPHEHRLSAMLLGHCRSYFRHSWSSTPNGLHL